jgi:SAM-dependent methyltransferase
MDSELTLNKQDKEWFDEWFDSPYYHLLYKHRDEEEAKQFINNLEQYFNFRKGQKAMDLACGKGRHSIYLAEKGLDVTGLDLSEKNIAFASRNEREHLKFAVHDMRETYKKEAFDYVFNLFTSFGYFADPKENEHTIQAVYRSSKPGGCFLIDFLNPQVVIDQLVSAESKVVDHIEFKISRFLEKGFIIKNIHFEDEGQPYFYQEKVKAITKKEFLAYFQAAGFQVKDMFGTYELEEYDEHASPRMIFVVQKNSNPK